MACFAYFILHCENTALSQAAEAVWIRSRQESEQREPLQFLQPRAGRRADHGQPRGPHQGAGAARAGERAAIRREGKRECVGAQAQELAVPLSQPPPRSRPRAVRVAVPVSVPAELPGAGVPEGDPLLAGQTPQFRDRGRRGCRKGPGPGPGQGCGRGRPRGAAAGGCRLAAIGGGEGAAQEAEAAGRKHHESLPLSFRRPERCAAGYPQPVLLGGQGARELRIDFRPALLGDECLPQSQDIQPCGAQRVPDHSAD